MAYGAVLGQTAVKTVADVSPDTNGNVDLTASDINAAPAYTYGTSDLTAGSSNLPTGTLYLVYE